MLKIVNIRIVDVLFVPNMSPKGGGRCHTAIKPPKDSSMTYEESEDLSFLTSKLEERIKWFVRKVYLDNLKE